MTWLYSTLFVLLIVLFHSIQHDNAASLIKGTEPLYARGHGETDRLLPIHIHPIMCATKFYQGSQENDPLAITFPLFFFCW